MSRVLPYELSVVSHALAAMVPGPVKERLLQLILVILCLIFLSLIPKCFNAFRIEDEDLSEPVADQLLGVELPGLSWRNVPGHVLPGSLPVAKRV